MADADYVARILGFPPYPDGLLTMMMARAKWDNFARTTPIPILSPILCDFSAKYLEPLVKAFNDMDYSQKADGTPFCAHATLYTDVMRAASRDSHWGRFQNMHPLGRNVLPKHALRISCSNVPPREDKDNFAQSIMFLWQLLVWEMLDSSDNLEVRELFKKDRDRRLPKAVRDKLIKMIGAFRRDCPGYMGTSTAEDCAILLSNSPDRFTLFRARIQRDLWEEEIKSRVVCGKKDNHLSRCSRCKIVAYCNAEHQKADWKQHKKRCVKPVWEVSLEKAQTSTVSVSTSTSQPQGKVEDLNWVD
ncbi:egl9-like protein 1 [Moniliophthora roreri MCA 2997]|uniref:Egl9-like protein 1 n=1 Tax=Moniliophthora roreri (strain MCA 2997) TaxID=1381753 RepID=V2XCN9_MONRO|nr:egl9-like protein 1 [Moniliophthora roreri MCA 2997]